MKLKYVALMDYTTMKSKIVEYDESRNSAYEYSDEKYMFIGFATSLSQVYHIIDMAYEMER